MSYNLEEFDVVHMANQLRRECNK